MQAHESDHHTSNRRKGKGPFTRRIFVSGEMIKQEWTLQVVQATRQCKPITKISIHKHKCRNLCSDLTDQGSSITSESILLMNKPRRTLLVSTSTPTKPINNIAIHTMHHLEVCSNKSLFFMKTMRVANHNPSGNSDVPLHHGSELGENDLLPLPRDTLPPEDDPISDQFAGRNTFFSDNLNMGYYSRYP